MVYTGMTVKTRPLCPVCNIIMVNCKIACLFEYEIQEEKVNRVLLESGSVISRLVKSKREREVSLHLIFLFYVLMPAGSQ
ncbi:hypothetical protein W909_03890 [Dickeya zeae EC1]|nr:hypothetical protein W909_03890 [Dickeya zeae EC1]